ncbi:hypothetical protein [Halarcobacter ebronensis]|uniref:Prepilin-type cleavage/methylation domain-containing protein n=1 Tax=Halarcobacter ebronensis TaxID=1462615 RepID=A0A4V1M0C9_9BACT|nr:hypothetical protein [Halarcobacter ebronensis]QKF81261.1 hypothetical protein AEBR_0761 [Halarcobacter ebronensis]RXK04827.1 hypothetical protein CRV07_09565 [Halarcobacter ebronensis]
MEKNSFTLLETLISLLLLSVIVVGFSKYSYYENFDEHFMLLNNLENSFTTNSYSSSFIKESKKITIIINDSELKKQKVEKISYKDDKVGLFKYEIN